MLFDNWFGANRWAEIHFDGILMGKRSIEVSSNQL